MTAEELFNLVKDLPEEAKPLRLRWRFSRDWLLELANGGEWPVDVPVAVLLFEASILRGLCRALMASKGMPHVSIVSPEDGDDQWRVFRSDRTHCIGVAPTLIEALVAAFRELPA